MSDIVARERLRAAQTTRFDVIVFFAAFFGGLLVYFALRFFGAHQSMQSLAIVLIMVAYAVAVSKVPKLRVRLDQAGDNAYYLGLLFTLASMAVALYTFSFSDVSGPEQIISNFGIALASTIMGIFLRVTLHQMRVDPADVESMTRIELAEASRRMKVSLDSVTGDLARFHDEVRQRMTDVMISVTDEYTKSMTALMSEVSSSTQMLLSGTETAQRNVLERTGSVTEKLDAAAESARASIDRLRAVEPPPLRLATRLDKVCESLEGLSVPIEGITRTLEHTAQASATAISQITAASSELSSLARGSREQQQEALDHIRQAARDFQTALAQAGDGLQQDKHLLHDLEMRVRGSTAQAERAQGAANEVLENLTTATKQITALVNAGVPPAKTPSS